MCPSAVLGGPRQRDVACDEADNEEYDGDDDGADGDVGGGHVGCSDARHRRRAGRRFDLSSHRHHRATFDILQTK